MGNCNKTPKKTTSDNITPRKTEISKKPYPKIELFTVTPAQTVTAPVSLPVIRLYGSPSSPSTSYIHFAILYKPVTLLFIPSQSPDFGFETPVIQYGSDVISGSSLTILRYLDSKFPDPQLVLSNFNGKVPLVVSATVLQHKSLTWHLERMVTWGEDLAARGGKSKGDPGMGSARMEVKKYAKSYSMLLELLLEHAQMEERVVFPVLEREDRGLSKTVTEEHARDLPLMNGIKEDIKTIIVLDSGSSSCSDALYSLSTRIKSLKENCKEHFEEEERGILPLMEAAELTQGQQERLLEQSLDVMLGTHSNLLKFFMEGLLPQEAMLYLDLITRCTNKDRAGSIYSFLVDQQVYVDTAGDPEKYRVKLSERFPSVKFTVAKKADSLYPVVSGASIVAKVTRDRALRNWNFDETAETCIEPLDLDILEITMNIYAYPNTISWLEHHKHPVLGFPSLVRFSWGTCNSYFKGGVAVLWEADKEDDESSSKTASGKQS